MKLHWWIGLLRGLAPALLLQAANAQSLPAGCPGQWIQYGGGMACQCPDGSLASGWPNIVCPLRQTTQDATKDITGEPYIGLDVAHIDPNEWLPSRSIRSNFGKGEDQYFQAKIVGVHPGSQAAAAGFQPGDVIVTISASQLGDRDVPSPEELSNFIRHAEQGGSSYVTIRLYRPSLPLENATLWKYLIFPPYSYAFLAKSERTQTEWLDAHSKDSRRRPTAEAPGIVAPPKSSLPRQPAGGWFAALSTDERFALFAAIIAFVLFAIVISQKQMVHSHKAGPASAPKVGTEDQTELTSTIARLESELTRLKANQYAAVSDVPHGGTSSSSVGGGPPKTAAALREELDAVKSKGGSAMDKGTANTLGVIGLIGIIIAIFMVFPVNLIMLAIGGGLAMLSGLYGGKVYGVIAGVLFGLQGFVSPVTVSVLGRSFSDNMDGAATAGIAILVACGLAIIVVSVRAPLAKS